MMHYCPTMNTVFAFHSTSSQANICILYLYVALFCLYDNITYLLKCCSMCMIFVESETTNWVPKRCSNQDYLASKQFIRIVLYKVSERNESSDILLIHLVVLTNVLSSVLQSYYASVFANPSTSSGFFHLLASAFDGVKDL